MADDFSVLGLWIATGNTRDADALTDRIAVGTVLSIILDDGVDRTRNLPDGFWYCHLKHPLNI